MKYLRTLYVILLIGLISMQIHAVIAEDNRLTAIAWNSDGTQVAVGDYSGYIRFYDQGGQLLKTIQAGEAPIMALEWYEDSTKSWLASAGFNHTIRVYNTKRDLLLREFIYPSSSSVTDLLWIKDGSQLVSTSISSDADPETVIWDMDTGTQVAHDWGGDISDLAWDSVDHRLALAGLAGIPLYDDSLLGELEILHWPEQTRSGFYPTRVAWHPGGQWLTAGYVNGAVSIWSASTNTFSFIASGLDAPSGDPSTTRILDIAFNPDGSKLTTVRSNGEVLVWDWLSKKTMTQVQLPNVGFFYYAKLSPDTSQVAFVNEDTGLLGISHLSSK